MVKLTFSGRIPDLGSGPVPTSWVRISNGTKGLVLDSGGDVGNGRYQIVNRGTGTALDGMGDSTLGATCAMWAPNSSPNNQWTIAAV